MRLAGTWQCELWGILRIQQCCDYMHLWLVHQGRIFSQAFGRRVWCLYSLRYHHARFSASGREDITDGWSTKAEFSVKNLDEECDACTLCGTTMRDFLHLVERTSPMVGPPRPNFQSRIWTKSVMPVLSAVPPHAIPCIWPRGSEEVFIGGGSLQYACHPRCWCEFVSTTWVWGQGCFLGSTGEISIHLCRFDM